MVYAKIKDMTLEAQIDRLEFQKAQLIAQRLRTDTTLRLTDNKIKCLKEKLNVSEARVH